MLILNRKVGESIIIDDDIEVFILEEKDGKIKVGIKAPEDVSILRKEVYEEVREENTKSLRKNINLLKLLRKE